MRSRVKTFDVAVGGFVIRVEAFDWRSAQIAAQKRWRDQMGHAPPLVRKSAVVKMRRPS